ncbi:MAG: SEC61-beta family protein [Candidatus Bathyarchaeia archaeon]
MDLNKPPRSMDYRTSLIRGELWMSKREKRRRREAPMPAASAGLLRFFEEETEGIKVRPEILLAMAVGLIALSIVVYLTP